MYDNPWLLNGAPFTSDMIGDSIGFVYEITDLTNNKKYIGKKNFYSTRKLPPLKGKTKKRKKVAESDWMEYYSSSEEIKLLAEEHGANRFRREILRLCESKGIMTYWEAKLQFEKNVLLSDEYYNEFIGCKIHSSHIKKLREQDGR
jgi:hypothetical protein